MGGLGGNDLLAPLVLARIVSGAALDWAVNNPTALAVAALAFLLLFRLRWSVLRTLGASALLGAAIHLAATA